MIFRQPPISCNKVVVVHCERFPLLIINAETQVSSIKNSLLVSRERFIHHIPMNSGAVIWASTFPCLPSPMCDLSMIDAKKNSG